MSPTRTPKPTWSHEHGRARAGFAEIVVEFLQRVAGLVELLELGVDGKEIDRLGVILLHHAVTCDIDEHVARVFRVDAARNLAAGIFVRAEYALEIGEARVAKVDDVLLAQPSCSVRSAVTASASLAPYWLTGKPER